MPKRPMPIQVSLRNKSLPEKNRQVVTVRNADSIFYYDIALGIRASYTVFYKREDIDSQFITYEFFYC